MYRNRRGVLGLALLAASVFGIGTNAAAAQKGGDPTLKHSVVILQDATLNGAQVAKGEYDAEITGADEAILVLRRDKKEVARARVHRNALPAPAKYDRVDVRSSAAGKEVVALFFKGDPRAFEIVPDQGVAIAEKP